MEVLILGVYLEIFFFRITWSKIRVRIIHGRALYTGKYGIVQMSRAMNNEVYLYSTSFNCFDHCFQGAPVNKDTKGTCHGVRFFRVSVPGGRGIVNKVLYGEAPSRGPTPYPF